MAIPVLSRSPSKAGRPVEGPKISTQHEVSRPMSAGRGHVRQVTPAPNGQGQQRDGNPTLDPVGSRSHIPSCGASLSHARSKSTAETLLTSSTPGGMTQGAGNITSMSRPRSIQPTSAIGKSQAPPSKPTRSHSTATSGSRNHTAVKSVPSAPTFNASSGIRSTTARSIPSTSIATAHSRTRSNASRRPGVDDTGRPAASGRQTAFGRSEAKPAASGSVHASIHPKAAPDVAPTIRKPAFNTFSQHFSPKKNIAGQTRTAATVKPGSISHPPPLQAPPSSGHAFLSANPADGLGSNIRICDELIQLSLVHDKAASNLHAYRSSVDLHIQSARRDVETQLASLSALERAEQQKLNTLTLRKWLRSTKDVTKVNEGNTALSLKSYRAKDQNGRGGWGIDQNRCKSDSQLLVLAQMTTRVVEIARQHGELDTLMSEFDQWCQSTLPHLPGGCDYPGGDMDPAVAHSLIPLNPQWASLVSSIETTVNGCRDSLGHLSTIGSAKDDQSCIVALIRTLSQVSEQILEEIAMCKVVEGLISRCQKDRVDMVLADALAEAAQVDMARDECVSTPHNHPRKGVWEDV
ncbi:hypothetical protein LTS17_001359 [Exophiala oligosperma]